MPTLTAPDGTLLVYDMYEAAAPRAAILALHGWADHAGRWRDVGERLCAAGYSTYILDLRGHGRSGGRRGHLSRFSQLLGDLQAFRRVVRLRTDRPQLLLGTSFGGLVALRYLETQPSDPIAGAVVVSPWLGLAFRPPAWRAPCSFAGIPRCITRCCMTRSATPRSATSWPSWPVGRNARSLDRADPRGYLLT